MTKGISSQTRMIRSASATTCPIVTHHVPVPDLGIYRFVTRQEMEVTSSQ